VIRDDGGRFVAAFTANLEIYSITRAELRSIVEGMKLAWNRGTRRLRILSDSKITSNRVSLITNNNSHTSLIGKFKELVAWDGQTSVHHTYREAYLAADHLVNLAHSYSLGIHVFNYLDVSL
ncbi:Putative ribonuclease H protein At1g65750, partial [Linum perenne]